MTQVVRLNVAIRPPLAAGRLQILDAEQRQVPPVLSSAYTA
jgi:hypothetical protein